MEMIYETKYSLDGIECNIQIEYKDDILLSVVISKHSHILKMVYMNDELLECVLDEHEMTIEHNKLTGTISGTQYDKDGYIAVDSKGLIYKQNNVQTSTNGNTFYKGKNVLTDDFKYLFTIRNNAILPKFKYSEEIYFLLSLKNNDLIPYYNIPNLPSVGLKEFVTALGEMLKQGVYLKYMDKIFGQYPSILVLDSNMDILDRRHTVYIEAELNSCKMAMITSDLGTTVSILDGDGISHAI